MRVDVIVNAKVLDVTKPLSRTKAAVGPVTYSGVGPNEDVARGNALKSAPGTPPTVNVQGQKTGRILNIKA